MQTTAWIVWVYGALVFAGGLMGWMKARSVPSLMAGLAFGLGLVVSGLYLWHGARIGLIAALVLATMLLVLMGGRFAKTKKFMPSGLIAALSLVAAIVFSVALGR